MIVYGAQNSGVGVRKERSALLVLVARPVDQPHHGLPERLAARKFGVGRLSPEKVGRHSRADWE
jgi:hypothetical protein